jgi:hypothetical protein
MCIFQQHLGVRQIYGLIFMPPPAVPKSLPIYGLPAQDVSVGMLSSNRDGSAADRE